MDPFRVPPETQQILDEADRDWRAFIDAVTRLATADRETAGECAGRVLQTVHQGVRAACVRADFAPLIARMKMLEVAPLLLQTKRGGE